MRIVFAGTPPFAAAALAALLDARGSLNIELAGVLTQPDRPAGRGMKTIPSAVKALAVKHGLEVLAPLSLNLARGGIEAETAHARVRALAPDVLVVAAYGLILPQGMLDIPAGLAATDGSRVRAINIHASLLPRWRGAAPVARAIAAGDAITGITLMQMEAGLDTGPILMMDRTDISLSDTTASLTAKLAMQGAALLLTGLREGEQGRLHPVPQPAEGLTYASKLDKREAQLDWRRPAAELACLVRAFDPFPGATANLIQAADQSAVSVKLWSAHVGQAADAARPANARQGSAESSAATGHTPGMVTAVDPQGLHIACGELGNERLVITCLQRSGGRRLAVRDFLAGTPVKFGERFAHG